ncbi:MAG: hypothetical protein DRJ15_13690, partial [Bacteroidetes bacterium]
QIITTNADGAYWVYAADIDEDGDMDVLSASLSDDKIAWHENTDGQGSFSSQQIITTNADGAISVYATDIDGDGDMDVLSASFDDNKIAWYENQTTLAVDQNTLISFSIYPIPTTGILTVKLKSTIAQMEIYNNFGQLIISKSNENKIDISTLSQGLYFCKVKDENGDSGIKKVVKE